MNIQGRRVIYKAIVGSHAYGLNTPQSDKDYIAVYLPTKEDLLGLQKHEQFDLSTKYSGDKLKKNTCDDQDFTAYSLPKYVRLLLQNNPNILETLFLPDNCIIEDSAEMKYLRNNYTNIVSQLTRKTFLGYAISQKHKALQKATRYSELRKLVEFLEHEFENNINMLDEMDSCLGFDWEGYLLTLSDITPYVNNQHGEKVKIVDAPDLSFIYNNAKRDLDSYGSRIVGNDMTEKTGYETKAAYHLIRIMEEFRQILQEGKIILPLTGTAKSNILKIKYGEMSKEDLLRLYDHYSELIVPDFFAMVRKTPNFKWANDFVIRTLYNNLVRS